MGLAPGQWLEGHCKRGVRTSSHVDKIRKLPHQLRRPASLEEQWQRQMVLIILRLSYFPLVGHKIQRPRSQLMAYFRWRRGTRSVHFGHPETPDEER
jgi:hypothetical protein